MMVLSYKKKWIDAEGLRIWVPDPLEVEDKYRDSAEKNNWEPFPYWTRIWPSARAMVRYLKEHHLLLAGKSVVEWGAGVGLPSFVAAAHAREVLVTDYIPEAMFWAEENIQQLKLANVQTAIANWHKGPYPDADLALLSDVSYDPDSFEALRNLIQHYLNAGSAVIIALPERIISGKFFQTIEKDIRHSSTYLIEDRLVVLALLHH